MRTLRMPEHICPQCNAILSAASSPDLGSPSPEDLTICLYCGAVLKFNRDLKPISVGDLELTHILQESPQLREQMEQVRSIVAVIQSTRGDR